MKILAIEQEAAGLAAGAFAPYLTAEAARVWELYQADIFRELYFDRDQHRAVIVLECAGIQEAQRELDTLPLVQEGLITFELIPLIPYPGLARLFAGQAEK